MADSTTLGGGDDLPLFVAETPRRRAPGDAANIESLRAKVRDLGFDLRRNWVAQAENSMEARPTGPAVAPARQQSARQEPVREEPARDPWVDELAEEYRQDYRQPPPARPATAAPVFDEPDERNVWADRAYAAGQMLFAFSAAIAPAAASVLRFLSARSGLALNGVIGVLLVLTVQGLLRDWPKPVAAAAEPPAPPVAWIDIAKPFPLFDLSAPSLGPVPPLYAARRHAAGGGREDVMTFGQFGGPKRFLRFSLYRHGTEETANPAYFVDMARRASASGLGVTEADLPQALPTRFGAFESAPLELSGPAGVKRRNCRGFRLDVEAPALTMGGLMCGAGDEKISAADLACVIDRLDLLSAGQDRALADFFGAAARRNNRTCGEANRRK